MDRQDHAFYARQLIAANGGLEKSATRCRAEKSSLADYQNVNGKWFMPPDVIWDLEWGCGNRIYSRALFEGGPQEQTDKPLLEIVMCATEATAALQGETRDALADGKLTPLERARLRKRVVTARDQLNEAEQQLAANE